MQLVLVGLFLVLIGICLDRSIDYLSKERYFISTLYLLGVLGTIYALLFGIF